MRKRWIILPLLVTLTGCADPLAGVERVTEIEDLPVENAATAVPTEAEMNRDTPILAGLFRRSRPDADSADAGAADASAEAVLAEPDLPTPDIAESAPEVSVQNDGEALPERRGGVLGWLRRAAAPETAADADAVVDEVAPTEGEVAEAEPPVILASATPEPDAKPRGLFGRAALAKPPAGGLATRDVAFGATLPFGEIARVCDAKLRSLGTLVEQAARKGAGYKLYDSAPDSAAPRTFYLTGFSDNCPRQFTAALALLGTPEFHEQLRYGLPAKEYPYSTTDKAYEKIKSQVCRVGRAKPCGPRISQLEQTTVFVSTYENFTENARWADILIHEGEVLAAALKTP